MWREGKRKGTRQGKGAATRSETTHHSCSHPWSHPRGKTHVHCVPKPESFNYLWGVDFKAQRIQLFVVLKSHHDGYFCALYFWLGVIYNFIIVTNIKNRNILPPPQNTSRFYIIRNLCFVTFPQPQIIVSCNAGLNLSRHMFPWKHKHFFFYC